MKTAVATARSGDYAASLQSLDKIISGEGADKLAANLVAEWTRLKPENRDKTNILVLDNATRLIVNTQIREVLKREGAIAAEAARIAILAPSGMPDQEKRSEEHTLSSITNAHLVCRILLEKKNVQTTNKQNRVK